MKKRITSCIKQPTNTSNEYRWQFANIGTTIQCDTTPSAGKAYMNIFSLINTGATYIKTQGFTINNNSLYLYDDKFSKYTTQEMNNYTLQNEIIVLFPLDTPIIEEITNPILIEELNSLYNINSINGTTIIEVVGDLPLVLKVRALKEKY